MRTGLLLVATILVVMVGLGWTWSAHRSVASKVSGEVNVRDFDESGDLGIPRQTETVQRSDSDWLALLGRKRFSILREKGTEAPGTGELLDNESDGYYVCAACKLPLFHSTGKFHSGCGWPSFFRPVALENIRETRDLSLGMVRTEITCARCGGHLGHVFEDGPRPTGLRYCVNSASLEFMPKPHALPVETDTAVFAAGCFWGVEKLYHETPGVLATRVGYTGGHVDRPTYKQVCTDTTGHAEAVEIVFDPARVSYAELARLFFLNHDPTTEDRQGPDYGSQYRSAVFFHDQRQKEEAESVRDSLVGAKLWDDPVVTKFEKATVFWPAEDYHQKYFLTHPIYCHPRKG